MTIRTYDELTSQISKYPDSKEAKFAISHPEIDFKAMDEEDPWVFKRFMQTIVHHPDDIKFVMKAVSMVYAVDRNIGKRLVESVKQSMAKQEAKILGLDLSKKRVDVSKFEIKTTRRGTTTISYDFNPVTDELEKAYGFQFRGIFEGIARKETVKAIKSLGYSKAEIDVGYRAAPTSGNECAILSWFLGMYDDGLVPYLDHWHYLLSHDFCELKRGGDNYMNDGADADEVDEDEPPLFAKIRQIYALECPARDEESIVFNVDW